MAKRKKAALPRVTVLAYGRRDLAEFAAAVDKIISSQFELERQLAQLKLQVDRLTAKGTNGRQRKSTAVQENGQGAGVHTDQADSGAGVVSS